MVKYYKCADKPPIDYQLLKPFGAAKLSNCLTDSQRATPASGCQLELMQLRRERLTMVFQSFALMPHLRVWENAAFGLDVAGMARGERRRKAEAGALRTVIDAASLARAAGDLLDDAPARRAMIGAAADYAKSEAGVLDDIVEALASALDRAAGTRS